MIARAATEPVTQREVKAELARVTGETEKFQQLEHSEELEAFRTGFRVPFCEALCPNLRLN